MTTTDLFAGLCRQLGLSPDRRGRVHMACPWCKKEVKPGQTHFSFSERGAFCFVCGEGGSLKKLVDALALMPETMPARRPRPQEPAKPRFWQQNPELVLQPLLESPTRLQDWQAYKPLTIETIARWKLGAGALPSSQCKHRRLIYPVYEQGRIVGFRGRATTCDCPKWLTAGGSKTVLWGLELVTPGATVIVVENPVDAMLAMQEEPGIVSVASTSGAATWREEWTAALVARRPVQILVWLDNDLAGCPNKETYRAAVAEWRRKHPEAQRVPEPNGPKIASALSAAQLPATIYHWPAGTPPKADLGWALSQ